MKDISYQIIKNGLDASALRQKIISSNISNVNTPGYKSSRVDFENVLQKAMTGRGSLVKTHVKHIGLDEVSEVTAKVVTTEGHTMDENGNNVDIDREMVNLAANEIYYNALIEQVNRKLSGMSYVINR